MTYFEWDPAKADSNFRKHGVSFGLATGVFKDPSVIVEIESVADGEQRWTAIGVADNVVCLVVVHTIEAYEDEGEVIRLISARRVSRKERKLYEVQIGK